MSEPIDLGAIRKREQAATKGPWVHGWGAWGWDYGIFPAGERPDFNNSIITNSGRGSGDPTEEDAAFIAHAREDVPALLTVAEKMAEALRETREVLAVSMALNAKLGKIELLTDELSRRGIPNGFGVRANDALALVTGPEKQT